MCCDDVECSNKLTTATPSERRRLWLSNVKNATHLAVVSLDDRRIKERRLRSKASSMIERRLRKATSYETSTPLALVSLDERRLWKRRLLKGDVLAKRVQFGIANSDSLR